MSYSVLIKFFNKKLHLGIVIWAKVVYNRDIKKERVCCRMDKYECMACGYVYDPAKGDEDGGIPAGTPFEDLPEDWVCPVCGVGKDSFEKI